MSKYDISGREATLQSAALRDDEKDATFALFAAFVAGVIFALIIGGII